MRYVVFEDPLHEAVGSLVRNMVRDGDEIFFAPHIVREAWNVLTRPVTNGGYAYSPAKAEAVLTYAEESLLFLDDTPDVYHHLKRLVAKYAIVGKSVHDANVVATALAHGATHVLTLDERDFRRYEEIETISP